MKKLTLCTQVLAAGTVLALGACGGSSSVSRPSKPSGSITATNKASVAEGAASAGAMAEGGVDGSSAKSSTTTSGFSGSSVNASLSTARKLGLVSRDFRMGLGANSECEPKVTGTTTDADSDGIAVDSTTTFDCSASEDGMSFTMSGSFGMQDKDDANKYGGWAFSLNNIKWALTGNENVTFNLATNGSGAVTLASGTYTGSIDQETEINVQDKSLTSGYYFDLQITPTDIAHPEAGGKIDKFEGFWSMKSVDANAEQLTLGVKSDALVYDSTCADEQYKSGSISFTDGNDKVLKLSWDNCNLTKTFDGTAF